MLFLASQYHVYQNGTNAVGTLMSHRIELLLKQAFAPVLRNVKNCMTQIAVRLKAV